jgi:hypothetical protein
MTTTQRHRVKLRDPGDLIAAVPHLLGFWPTNSLVISAHTGPTGAHVALCMRADIPPPDLYWALAEQLKLPILRANACAVTLVVVCEDTVDPPLPLPHAALIEAVTSVFSAVGVSVYHSLWAPTITRGANWWCYDSVECNGQVPDPATSELAAASAANGVVTYDSREEMRATLEPTDRYPLTLRAERIAMALSQYPDEGRAHQLVSDAIADVREGTFTLDDDRVVDLAVALSQSRVRDTCLKPEVTQLGPAIERMWIDLTRAMPAPYRAEPASLLAVTAFLRGDGALAGVALEAAFQADPDHVMSHMLRGAMDIGLPPAEVAQAVAQGVSEYLCSPPPDD